MKDAHSISDSSGQGFGAYYEAIRTHKYLVVLITLLTMLAAVAWSQFGPTSYKSTAQLLVSPLDQTDTSFLGLDMLRDSGDPTRTIETAATIVYTPESAEQTAEELGGDWNRQSVLDAVAVEPEGQTNVLAITGTADTAEEASELANTFASVALASREENLTQQVESEKEFLEQQIESLPAGDVEARQSLTERIGQLDSILNNGDPTLTVSSPATPPEDPEGVGLAFLLPLALIGGLMLGSGAAILVAAVNPRVQDESELESVWDLPVLARVPIIKSYTDQPTRTADMMPPPIREAHRTVLAQLDTLNPRPRSLVVTSPSTGDGKTTAAVDLALTYAASGRSVILFDFDLRRPRVAAQLGIENTSVQVPIKDLIVDEVPLFELLQPVEHVLHLQLLAPQSIDGDVVVLDTLNQRLPGLIAEARELAEVIVIDSPPIGEISDALSLAHHVDSVLMVVRPGHTDRESLMFGRDLLHRAHRDPIGYLVVGGVPETRGSYYSYGIASSRPSAAASNPTHGHRHLQG